MIADPLSEMNLSCVGSTPFSNAASLIIRMSGIMTDVLSVIPFDIPKDDDVLLCGDGCEHHRALVCVVECAIYTIQLWCILDGCHCRECDCDPRYTCISFFDVIFDTFVTIRECQDITRYINIQQCLLDDTPK